MPSQGPFLQLPNELLLLIAAGLDDDSLLHLAATSKRLNLLLVPGLFTRCDFKLPALFSGALPSLVFNGETLVVLPAIGIASFVTSIEDLDCAFFAYNRYVLPKEIFDAAQALNALALRLKHLGHLRFNPYVAGHSTHELFGWSNAVATFLNSAVHRGDCAVTVYSGLRDDYVADPRPYSHVFRVQNAGRASSHSRSRAAPLTIRQRLRRALASLFRITQRRRETAVIPSASASDTPVVESTERPPGVTLPLPSKSALTTLNIHSPFLLHANFYRWTLHVLNTSPRLSSLSLNNIDLSHYDWALTLPRLALPALSHFAVGQCAITVPDLDTFLLRHPGIEVLDLAFHGAIGALVPSLPALASKHDPATGSGTPTPTPATFLPRLVTLTATPDYLLYFLADSIPSPSSSDYHLHATPWYPRLRAIAASSNDESSYQVARFVSVACEDVGMQGQQIECVEGSVSLCNAGGPRASSNSCWTRSILGVRCRQRLTFADEADSKVSAPAASSAGVLVLSKKRKKTANFFWPILWFMKDL
ncbi:hypothetical protein K438DRAFT_1752418 [Mycena galopus ATCC 62051]|nr:hypothetical protein K438DRAFT_1752418 [Mycena galopus ATCC 62051]